MKEKEIRIILYILAIVFGACVFLIIDILSNYNFEIFLLKTIFTFISCIILYGLFKFLVIRNKRNSGMKRNNEMERKEKRIMSFIVGIVYITCAFNIIDLLYNYNLELLYLKTFIPTFSCMILYKLS